MPALGFLPAPRSAPGFVVEFFPGLRSVVGPSSGHRPRLPRPSRHRLIVSLFVLSRIRHRLELEQPIIPFGPIEHLCLFVVGLPTVPVAQRKSSLGPRPGLGYLPLYRAELGLKFAPLGQLGFLPWCLAGPGSPPAPPSVRGSWLGFPAGPALQVAIASPSRPGLELERPTSSEPLFASQLPRPLLALATLGPWPALPAQPEPRSVLQSWPEPPSAPALVPQPSPRSVLGDLLSHSPPPNCHRLSEHTPLRSPSPNCHLSSHPTPHYP